MGSVVAGFLLILGFITSTSGLATYSASDTRLNRVGSLVLLWGGMWLGIAGVLIHVG